MKDAIEPAALLKRAERLLWLAETISAKAQEADDSRLALQAVDRARASLETMMRAVGMIGGDVTVNIGVAERERLSAQDAVRAILSVMPNQRLVPALLEHIDAAASGREWPEAINPIDVTPLAELTV